MPAHGLIQTALNAFQLCMSIAMNSNGAKEKTSNTLLFVMLHTVCLPAKTATNYAEAGL